MKTITDYVNDLAAEHFGVDPGIDLIVWFRPAKPDESQEIRLLEVNRDALKGDLFPVAFRASDDLPFRLVIAELHPDEWRRVKDGTLPLPEDWQASERREIPRPPEGK